jgi:5-methylcytosine-specific restriction enzyme subunit McrC
MEVGYDDYTVDIPENRVLAAAARRLLRLPGVPAAARAVLHRIGAALADVTPLVPGAPVPATAPTRLTRRYQPALRLARLVLAGRSIELPAGRPAGPAVAANGFLFDMNAVFEDWLTAALRRALELRGGAVDGHRVVRVDEAGRLPAWPDITWWDGPVCLAVVDAKYKAPEQAPAADLYQVLAYCTALGLPDGHLVYAGGTPATHTLRRAGTRLHAHTVDLAASVADLLTQVDALAQTISEGADSPIRPSPPPSDAHRGT